MSTFDARAHLIILKGKGGAAEYLPVAARIAWFRADHPDGHIAVEAHTITDQIAIFHARVSVPEGGSAEGWGSETPRDFGDFIEKASTKALGRALLALGYGTLQAGPELDEGERLADAPVATARNAAYDAVLAQAWALAEAGRPVAAVKDWLNAHRHSMDREQRALALAELAKIQERFYAADTPADKAVPTSVAG